MTSPQLLSRMKREIQMLEEEPPHGIYCWPSETNMRHLHAQIRGYEKTPYENGIFKLDIHVPDRYPFEPPHIQFKTPIYHPNVDNDGRICLDILKLPPKGSWKPSLNISTVLTSISVLMQDPNPDDPLLTEIADEYKSNYPLFVIKAKDYTKKYAITKVDDNNLVNKTNHEDEESQVSNTSSENEILDNINSKSDFSIFNPILMSNHGSTTSHNLSKKKLSTLKKSLKKKDHKNTESSIIDKPSNNDNNKITDATLHTFQNSNHQSTKLEETTSTNSKNLLSKKKSLKKKKPEVQVIDLEELSNSSSHEDNDPKEKEEKKEEEKEDLIIINNDYSNPTSSNNNSENESSSLTQEKPSILNLSKSKKRLNLKKHFRQESLDSTNDLSIASQDNKSESEDMKKSLHSSKRKYLSEEENNPSSEVEASLPSTTTTASPVKDIHAVTPSKRIKTSSLDDTTFDFSSTPKENLSLNSVSSLYEDFNFDRPSKPKSKLRLSMKKKRKN